jgi:thiamine biosynthesis lipoprotein
MGGDMRLLGQKNDNTLYNIGINDPDNAGCLMTLYMSDRSIATSGTYERSFSKDGTLYHHILDPSTGKSVETDIKSITVISKNSLDCDCLCTVSILLGSKKATELIEKTPETEAVILLNDNTVLKTSGADRYIRQ